MRLLTLQSGDRLQAGVLVGDEVLHLFTARVVFPEAALVPETLAGLLAAGPGALTLVAELAARAAHPAQREALRAHQALRPYASTKLAPVIPEPALLLAGSMNSRGHLAEMGDVPAEHPCAFLKVRSAIAASGSDIELPAGEAEMIDWEGEFCLVIGKPCHRVTVEHAMDYVVGYSLMNDVSAREYVMPFVRAKGAVPAAQAWERNVLGKNYPTFAPIGPVIATKDELPMPLRYKMETLVNGEVMQSSTEEDLVFGPAEMVSYFSRYYRLMPGDIISLGSPPGVGMAQKPPRFLRPGDQVEVRVAEIGSLINGVRHG
jgi:acylpyruvate hydrolase